MDILRIMTTILTILTLQAQEAEIDNFIEWTLDCYNIPGLSLAVLKDGQDFMAKGYGVRDLETQEPVTNETLTLINSNTKAFVGVSAAIVIKNNSAGLDWDTPIREILGNWFFLNDSLRTSHVTLRDLLAHRTGLSGYTYYYFSGFTGEEAIRRIQYLPFSADFRDVFIYNNLMYALAGYVIETVTGSRWEDVAIENIFEPLEMTDTTFIWDESQWENMMSGYDRSRDGIDSLRKISPAAARDVFSESMTAAGGIVSNALDMLKWMQFQLNEGKTADGQEILTKEEFQVTHMPTNHVARTPLYQRPEDPVHLSVGAYSIGWWEKSYRDYLISAHSGSGWGYRSLVTIVKNMGVAIFTGTNKWANFYEPVNEIHMYIIDQLLGYEPWMQNKTCPFPKRASDTSFYEEENVQGMDEDLVDIVTQNERFIPFKKLGQAFDCVDAFECGADDTSYDSPEASSNSKQDTQRELYVEDVVGVYGHYGLGNLTVYQNDTSGGLLVESGSGNQVWELEPLMNSTRTFLANGKEPHWYKTYLITFIMGEMDTAEALLLESRTTNAKFYRSLDWNNPPPPPEICPKEDLNTSC